MNKTAVALQKQLGNDMAGWQWKKVHSIEHKHPLGILPVAGKWFNVGPIAVNGGQETINNLDFSLDSSGLYKVLSGPALRRIIDLGDADKKFSVNPTGQSGYFMSPHYKDQAQMFADGGKRPELTDRKQIEKVMIGKTVFYNREVIKDARNCKGFPLFQKAGRSSFLSPGLLPLVAHDAV